jgi:hypothetical protein
LLDHSLFVDERLDVCDVILITLIILKVKIKLRLNSFEIRFEFAFKFFGVFTEDLDLVLKNGFMDLENDSFVTHEAHPFASYDAFDKWRPTRASDGDSVGTLGRQIIPMMLTAEPLNQRYPHLGIALELGGFVWIYDVL